MEENKSHTKDKIFAAVIILVLCVVATATLTIDSKYTSSTKESVQTTIKKEGN